MKKLITLIILLLSVTVFSQNYIDASDTVIENVQEIETITDSTKVAVIDNNGIMKYVEKGDISEEVTQYFLSITEGTHPGYAHKYRADNPDNYGNLGRDAVDLSFSTSTSSTKGATGLNSFAAGRNTTASGDQSVAMGDGSQATGIRSVAIGSQNTASGGSAVALGYSNVASDGYTVAMGYGNTASRPNSTAIGYGNTASGHMSTAMGRGNTANSVFSTFIGGWGTVFAGQNHITWIATDILFNVGNGTNSSSRSNALSLFKNGRLELPSYGDGVFTGTATKLLAVDADGKVIEEDLPTSGGSLTITDNDQVEAENVNTINFVGATVTDNEDGSVDVEYISGGSSITIGTDGQIPFTNSSNDDFEYSDNFKLTEYGALKLENTWLGGGALSLEDGNKLGQITPDYIRIGDDSGSNPYFNITTTGDMFFRRNGIGTYPSLRLTNAGTGDAGIGFLAGSRGVTMGIDNSDGDLFKISVGSSIPNVGAGTVILEADNNQIKLPIYGSGTITGTATKLLAVDADGKVIEEDLPSGGSSITIGTENQIPFTNSSDDDFDYSSEFIYDGALKITKNDSSTDRNIAIVNSGTGDASIGLMAGNRGVTMGIDNSDSDLFKIAIGNGAIPDLGVANNIIRAEFGALTLDLKSTGIGYYLSDNWYTAITNNGFSAQTSNTAYSRVISNQGFITQSSAGNQISLSPEGNIKSTVGTSTDITLQLNNGARGEFSLPDLGNATTEDIIVTQTTQTVKQAKVTINPLEFRSISSNPIEIVSAQGAGTVINIIGATAFLDYDSAPFNFVGEVYLRVGNNPSWSIDSADVNVSADNYISFKAPTQSSSGVGNSSVVITSGSDSLAGNSDVTIIITYTIDDYN